MTLNTRDALFSAFEDVWTQPILALSDRDRLPRWITQFYPSRWGWFVGVAGLVVVAAQVVLPTAPRETG